MTLRIEMTCMSKKVGVLSAVCSQVHFEIRTITFEGFINYRLIFTLRL